MEVLLTKRLCDKFKLLSLAVALFFNSTYAQIDTPEDCIDSYRICDASHSYYFEVSGDGNIDDANGALGLFCINQSEAAQWEHNSAWFKFTAQFTGEFGFLVCPDINEDWDVALFGNNPDCSNLADSSYQIACNEFSPNPLTDNCKGIGYKNGFGGGTESLLAYIAIQAGNTYILHAQCRNAPITTPRRATLSFQGQVVTDHPDLFDFAGCTMSTNDFALESKVKVFPNPFQDFINIESEIGFKTIELYDVMGKMVVKQDFVKRLDTSKIAKGFYLLKLTTEDGSIINKKIIR